MILIIEGMDNCGKSTLIKNLRKEYFANPRTIVHHSTSPPKVDDPNLWELKHYELMFTEAEHLDSDGWDIIFDRFHLGATVYGKKYRGMDPDRIFEIDSYHTRTTTIVLTDTYEGIMSRDDGDSIEQSKEEYDETRGAFIEAFTLSYSRNKKLINISEIGIDKLYETVIQYLNQIEERL